MSTYGWVLIASVAFPLLLSFDRKVAFWRKWPRALLSAFIIAPGFVLWDAIAAARGDWGFAQEHILDLRLFGLPVEEVLFFLLVPFCCVFVRLCVDAYFPDKKLTVRSWPYAALALAAIAAIFAVWPRFYTATLLGFAALFLLLLAGPWRRRAARRNFWLTQALCLLPFALVNGVLTALPVVRYAPEAILGPRLGSIPVEDALYSFVLVGANLLVFEALEERRAKAERSRKTEHSSLSV